MGLETHVVLCTEVERLSSTAGQSVILKLHASGECHWLLKYHSCLGCRSSYQERERMTCCGGAALPGGPCSRFVSANILRANSTHASRSIAIEYRSCYPFLRVFPKGQWRPPWGWMSLVVGKLQGICRGICTTFLVPGKKVYSALGRTLSAGDRIFQWVTSGSTCERYPPWTRRCQDVFDMLTL